MDHFDRGATLRWWCPAFVLVMLSAALGCSKSASPEAQEDSQAAADLPPLPAEPPPLEAAPAESLAGMTAVAEVPTGAPLPFQSPSVEPHQGHRAADGVPDPVAQQPHTERPLRDDLTPAELVNFLASADKDMELIHSGRAGLEDPREIRQTLLQIVNRKLQAARRVAAHEAASEKQRSEGKRGELQALSHLAALSDVKAAEELEALATANMESEDPQLVSDSRLVLVGFAIEALQNGKSGAAERMMTYIDQIAGSDSAADVPALIVMGQAKQALENYGNPELAQQVRDTIIEKFGDSTNPDVASIAAQLAGNVQYDDVDKLRAALLDGNDVELQVWTDAVETLIEKSPDLQTVRYLAAAAVDFESAGLTEQATATLRTLRSRFTQPDAATTREVDTAVKATAARREIIGKPLQIDLPTLSGDPLSLDDFQGKIVLIPFWGTGIPLSLQPIATLQAIRDANPDQIAVVGVNLDPPEAPVDEFLQANALEFPNFSLSARPESALPRRLGMVSMPFVVVIGRDGTVAAIQLSDRNLRETVERLVAQ